MLTVVEPGLRSIETAGRIVELGRQIDIRNFGAIINKAGNQVDTIVEKLDGYGVPVLGAVPYDTGLIEADMENIAPIDSGGDAVKAIKDIWKKINQERQA